MAKFKNMCVREAYTDKSGAEKVSWNRIGTIFTGANGKEYVKLFHMPGVLVSVFEAKEKEEREPGQDDVEV